MKKVHAIIVILLIFSILTVGCSTQKVDTKILQRLDPLSVISDKMLSQSKDEISNKYSIEGNTPYLLETEYYGQKGSALLQFTGAGKLSGVLYEISTYSVGEELFTAPEFIEKITYPLLKDFVSCFGQNYSITVNDFIEKQGYRDLSSVSEIKSEVLDALESQSAKEISIAYEGISYTPLMRIFVQANGEVVIQFMLGK